jgi:hypothetical protein
MTIHAYLDYLYYDGLLTFSQLYVRCDDPKISSWRVQWLFSEWDEQGVVLTAERETE